MKDLLSLEDGYYVTHPTSLPLHRRVVNVADGRVKLVYSRSGFWFYVSQFFKENVVERQLTEEEVTLL